MSTRLHIPTKVEYPMASSAKPEFEEIEQPYRILPEGSRLQPDDDSKKRN